ncbi:MAG TPA: HDIG domain-containing protein [Bacteroidales bacterium]|nr:HDIG domain-containing protein [Bacteroidales bacterium]
MATSKKWLSTKSIILLAVMFFVSIALIVYIYPHEGKFRYEYQKGKPWMHERLIAPWDFPIYKTEIELVKERDSILTTIRPFFDYDTSVYVREISSFGSYFNEVRISRSGTEQELSLKYYELVRTGLTDILTNAYRTGIFELNEDTEELLRGDEEIVLVKGNVAQVINISNLFTHKSAYEYVKEQRDIVLMGISGNIDLRLFEFANSLSLYDFIKPNIIYNLTTSESERNQMLSDISLTRGLVQQGELIISEGELVNDWRFRILESLRYEYGAKVGIYNTWLLILGQFLIVSACYLILFLFLYHFRREILESFKRTLFILFLILAFIVITRVVIMVPDLSVYLIPFAIIPVVTRTFYDPRLALFILLVTMMITGFIVPNSFEFVFLNILGGVVVIFTLTNTYRRGKLFFSASMVFLILSTVYFAIAILQEGDMKQIEWFNFAWFAGNSILILISYPLIFIFEKTFGFLSDATLFELSDTNQPLLRRLAEKAPGSFQHSMQVAILAEDASRVINANTLLLRAGALYHDIGKVTLSEYFTENQSDGFNPHDKIDPEDSARLIISHIERGLELARKTGLPEQIIDFIRTHQGTTKAYYFYRKFKDRYPGTEADPDTFAYPGPKPFSKETALLMMADSVEAASRSLKEYSDESIRNLVEGIIDHQMQEDQFTEAPITFRDISSIKDSFVRRLTTIYHARISYPNKEVKEEEKQNGNNQS